MADTKISALPAVTTLASTDIVPVDASSVTSRITIANLAAFQVQVSSTVGFTTGSSTYGPTSATVNGNISVGGGTPSGFYHDEFHFGATPGSGNHGLESSDTGSPVMYFDFGATSNTGSWAWRNGTAAATARMTLSSAGSLTLNQSGSFLTGSSTYGPTSAMVNGSLSVSGTSSTIQSGTGAASGTQPKGSIWIRTDGGVGSTIYVSQGGGTWNAIAGV